MTRADLILHIKYPETNRTKIIIPTNQDGNGFKKTCYSDEYMNMFISKEEFNEVIVKADLVVQRAYSLQRKYDNKTISSRIMLIYAMAFLVLIAALITFYQGAFG